jgi:hypothetical protein
MTIAATDLAVDLLKNRYLDPLRVQISERSDVVWANLSRNTEDVAGGKARMALRYGRSGGVGFRAETGDLPTPNPRKTSKVEFETRNLYGSLEITDKLLKAARGGITSFAPALETYVADLEADAKEQVAIATHLTPDLKLATITAASWASNVLTLTLDGNLQRFAEGQYLDIWDNSAGAVLTNGAGLEVTVVDEVNSQVKLSSTNIASGIEANADYLVPNGSKGYGLTGLDAWFTPDNTIFGIDRSANKWFNPTRVNVNGEISENVIMKALNQAETFGNGNPRFGVGSDGVARAFADLLLATKTSPDPVKLNGGWEGLAFRTPRGTVSITGSKYAPSGKLRILDLDHWAVYQIDNWDWMPGTNGEVLHPVPSSKVAYRAVLVLYPEIACDAPKGQVELYGITEH